MGDEIDFLLVVILAIGAVWKLERIYSVIMFLPLWFPDKLDKEAGNFSPPITCFHQEHHVSSFGVIQPGSCSKSSSVSPVPTLSIKIKAKSDQLRPPCNLFFLLCKRARRASLWDGDGGTRSQNSIIFSGSSSIFIVRAVNAIRLAPIQYDKLNGCQNADRCPVRREPILDHSLATNTAGFSCSQHNTTGSMSSLSSFPFIPWLLALSCGVFITTLILTLSVSPSGVTSKFPWRWWMSNGAMFFWVACGAIFCLFFDRWIHVDSRRICTSTFFPKKYRRFTREFGICNPRWITIPKVPCRSSVYNTKYRDKTTTGTFGNVIKID